MRNRNIFPNSEKNRNRKQKNPFSWKNRLESPGYLSANNISSLRNPQITNSVLNHLPLNVQRRLNLKRKTHANRISNLPKQNLNDVLHGNLTQNKKEYIRSFLQNIHKSVLSKNTIPSIPSRSNHPKEMIKLKEIEFLKLDGNMDKFETMIKYLFQKQKNKGSITTHINLMTFLKKLPIFLYNHLRNIYPSHIINRYLRNAIHRNRNALQERLEEEPMFNHWGNIDTIYARSFNFKLNMLKKLLYWRFHNITNTDLNRIQNIEFRDMYYFDIKRHILTFDFLNNRKIIKALYPPKRTLGLGRTANMWVNRYQHWKANHLNNQHKN